MSILKTGKDVLRCILSLEDSNAKSEVSLYTLKHVRVLQLSE